MRNIELSFGGEAYTVSENKTFELIDAIEEHVTMSWLAPRLQSQQVPLVKIYKGYAAALTYAGAKGVTVEKIGAGVSFSQGLEMAFNLAHILSLAYCEKTAEPIAVEPLPDSKKNEAETEAETKAP